MPFKCPERKRQYQRDWKRQRREDWIEAMGGECVECGSKEKLEVHHNVPAKKVTSSFWSFAEAKRLKELAHCKVLCHNCHVEWHRKNWVAYEGVK